MRGRELPRAIRPACPRSSGLSVGQPTSVRIEMRTSGQRSNHVFAARCLEVQASRDSLGCEADTTETVADRRPARGRTPTPEAISGRLTMASAPDVNGGTATTTSPAGEHCLATLLHHGWSSSPAASF